MPYDVMHSKLLRQNTKAGKRKGDLVIIPAHRNIEKAVPTLLKRLPVRIRLPS